MKISQTPPVQGELTTAICVVQAGHVFIAKVEIPEDDSGTMRMWDARIIRRWGTSRGLGELYDGPVEKSEIDARVPLILLPLAQLIYCFPVPDNPKWWSV